MRDLSPSGQEALERRVLGWLRRALGIGPPNIGTAVESTFLSIIAGHYGVAAGAVAPRAGYAVRVGGEEEPAGD